MEGSEFAKIIYFETSAYYKLKSFDESFIYYYVLNSCFILDCNRAQKD